MPAKIRLLIVDDEAMIRQGLAGLLALEPDFEIVGMAANGADAIAKACSCNPDVILMDVQMPVLDGIEATRRLVCQNNEVRILILTTFAEDDFIVEALKNGAHGYLLKDCGGRQLAQAVRSAMAGFTTLAKQAVDTIVAYSNMDCPEPKVVAAAKLTAREREVLACLAEGCTNSQIAARLSVTEKTVRDHVSNILGELRLRDRTQAALWARNYL